MDVARRMIMLHRSIRAMRQTVMSSRVRVFLHIFDATRLPASEQTLCQDPTYNAEGDLK